MGGIVTDTVTFAPNKLAYGQDFGFHRGIPAGIVFVVEDRGPQCRLSAPGYGDQPYGNGALLVAAEIVRAAQAEGERVADWEDCA